MKGLWQDCTIYFEDAGNRLHYMIQAGESKVIRVCSCLPERFLLRMVLIEDSYS